ncbi:MAG: MmcQ/YjbR family DNA-binding protein [Saccharospirillum sp.]|nr:MmcQ/YjbR family DNA-binding protein [Saccharospirillum sp.]
MTYDEFNDFCTALPATSHVIQWGGAHVWKVGGKVFAIGGWGPDDEPAFTFKTSDLDFDVLHNQPGFRPAPYLASRGMKWIQQIDLSGPSAEELKYYIRESHRLVSLGLPKKRQKELGLNQVS